MKNSTLQQRVTDSLKGFSGTAIKFKRREITYPEYDQATDRIARNLAARGIAPGDVVCLKMKRSEKMLMALGGIIRSGAALLPVQDSVAPKRLEVISETVDIAMMVTDENIDELLNSIPDEGAQVSMAGPDDDAVIVFTSGSTGKPKGVRHSQYAFGHMATQHPDELKNIGIENITISSIIAKTSVDFMSAYDNEYMPFLLAGIPLILLTEDEMNNAAVIAGAIRDNDNCGIFLTPSQAESYMRQEKIDFTKLNCLILAGEPLSDMQRENIVASVTDNTQVVSCYGATECHVITASNCRSWDKTNGTVCEGYSVIIADKEGNICENGAEGEILVYSPKLLTDYIGAEVNMTDFNGHSYFHTKDYGVKTDDGRVIIKGRIDRMIKYHGQRVELGEIEKNVMSFPGIKKAAVSLADTEVGTEVLCIYYEAESNIDIKILRRYLLERMPVYMIPAGFIRLEKLPVNDHGKIDYMDLRKRVFRAEHNEDSSGEAYEASELVRKICAAAAKILKCSTKIVPKDDLFRLGMDSLMAYGLINALEKDGYLITLKEIFADPVIANLAKKLRPVMTKESSPAEIYTTEEKFTATMTQSFWGTDVDPFKKTIGFYNSECFLCGKGYSKDEFEARVKKITERHPAFAARFAMEGFMPSQTISGTPTVITEYYDIADKASPELPAYELSDGQRQFIENYRAKDAGSIIGDQRIIDLKAVCFAVGGDASVILFTCNHASTDAMSMKVLRDEFLDAELTDGEDSYVSYLRFIGDQKNAEEAMRFWLPYLNGAEPATVAVEGAGYQQNRMPDLRSYTIKLGKEDTHSFTDRCRNEKITAAGYVMYAYGKALLEVLEKKSIIMQILTFGRGIPVKGIEKTVGCILQTVPVVINADDTPETFKTGYVQCDRYSYLPLPLLWHAVLGNQAPPALPPFLVSEIFPESETDVYCRDMDNTDYANKPMGNFITMDEKNGLSVYFHYDANIVSEDKFLSVIKATEKNIMSFK